MDDLTLFEKTATPFDAPAKEKSDREDRRVRRSIRLLKESLLQLMEQKSFSKITVKDITDRADMNRGTFYLHFSDTTELLHRLMDDLVEEAQSLIDAHKKDYMESGSLKSLMDPLLDFVVANRRSCEVLFNNNEATGFTLKLQQIFHLNGYPLLKQRFPEAESGQLDYLLNFTAYGIMGVVHNWFKNNMTLSHQDLFDYADRMMNGAARGLLQA